MPSVRLHERNGQDMATAAKLLLQARINPGRAGSRQQGDPLRLASVRQQSSRRRGAGGHAGAGGRREAVRPFRRLPPHPPEHQEIARDA
jgi:hypothetical protein